MFLGLHASDFVLELYLWQLVDLNYFLGVFCECDKAFRIIYADTAHTCTHALFKVYISGSLQTVDSNIKESLQVSGAKVWFLF